MPHRCVPSSFRVIYRRIMSIPRYDTLSLPAYGRPIPLRDSSNLQSEFNILTRKSSSFVASVPGEEGGAIVALTSLLRRDEF